MNTKLWQKNNKDNLNKIIEKFTVGDDYLLDQKLIQYDIKASLVHAAGLNRIGILTEQELTDISNALTSLKILVNHNQFKIKQTDEDCHTAIENYLTITCGEAGKKIHTGRSRNDQILVVTRLYLKDKLVEVKSLVTSLLDSLNKQIAKNGYLVMPGYTHMQRAMPSSVGCWLGSFHDAMKDDLILLKAISIIIDQNPLGSVVGYGETTLGLDRVFTTKELNFAKTQLNPMYCAMSRGKFELMYLQFGQQIIFSLNKLATDLMLFTAKEYDFCYLPSSLTTGSSAMPQKKNYDICELIRAKGALFNGLVTTMSGVIEKLPSGYNRDFQLSKKILLDGCELLEELLIVSSIVIDNLHFNNQELINKCSPELYATDEAYKLVKEKNIPFRDAYQQIAKKYT